MLELIKINIQNLASIKEQSYYFKEELATIVGINKDTSNVNSNISDEELEKIVDYTVSQQKAMYDERFMDLTSSAKEQGNAGGGIKEVEEEYDDPLYNDIVEFVITQGKASASLLQRRFKLGYNRAARIVDLLEERGIIGPQNGSKPREVLVKLRKK